MPTTNSRDLKNEIRLVITRLLSEKGPLSFDELRKELESSGIFIKSKSLRFIIASMIRDGILTKQPDINKRKFTIKLVRP